MFLSQRDDRTRMPVALLSGFLGSGKTTLVNALLRDPAMANTAVAMNEFGEVPIDRDLIDHGPERTMVMANGCLCCNLVGDLDLAVMRLFSRRRGRRAAGFCPADHRTLGTGRSGADRAGDTAQSGVVAGAAAGGDRDDGRCQFGAAQLARHAETRKQVVAGGSCGADEDRPGG